MTARRRAARARAAPAGAGAARLARRRDADPAAAGREASSSPGRDARRAAHVAGLDRLRAAAAARSATPSGSAPRPRPARSPSRRSAARGRGWSTARTPEPVALSETAAAVARARLAGIDAAVLRRPACSDARRADVLRRGFDEVGGGGARRRAATGCATRCRRCARPAGPPPALRRGCSARQPRAGATCPGRPRLVVEPPERHADHCLTVAVYGVLVAPLVGADPVVPFLVGLAHHLHNVPLPDAGLRRRGAARRRTSRRCCAELERRELDRAAARRSADRLRERAAAARRRRRAGVAGLPRRRRARPGAAGAPPRAGGGLHRRRRRSTTSSSCTRGRCRRSTLDVLRRRGPVSALGRPGRRRHPVRRAPGATSCAPGSPALLADGDVDGARVALLADADDWWDAAPPPRRAARPRRRAPHAARGDGPARHGPGRRLLRAPLVRPDLPRRARAAAAALAGRPAGGRGRLRRPGTSCASWPGAGCRDLRRRRRRVGQALAGAALRLPGRALRLRRRDGAARPRRARRRRTCCATTRCTSCATRPPAAARAARARRRGRHRRRRPRPRRRPAVHRRAACRAQRVRRPARRRRSLYDDDELTRALLDGRPPRPRRVADARGAAEAVALVAGDPLRARAARPRRAASGPLRLNPLYERRRPALAERALRAGVRPALATTCPPLAPTRCRPTPPGGACSSTCRSAGDRLGHRRLRLGRPRPRPARRCSPPARDVVALHDRSTPTAMARMPVDAAALRRPRRVPRRRRASTPSTSPRPTPPTARSSRPPPRRARPCCARSRWPPTLADAEALVQACAAAGRAARHGVRPALAPGPRARCASCCPSSAR